MPDHSPAETPPEDPDPHPTGSAEARVADSARVLRQRPRRRRRRGSFLRELPVLLVVAFGLAVLIKTFLVQAFFIPSGSMERTLHGCPGCSGDRVMVNKLTYRFREPRPGDIVVFRGPESWTPEAQFAEPTNVVQRALRAVGSAVGVAPPGEKDFIKRVIAVGGQTVQCCDGQGRVTVGGKALNEPYVYVSDPQASRATPFGPVTVPKGRLWVMGDHRDQSADSRAHIADPDQGTIPTDDVVGKAFVVVWPPSRWTTLGSSATFTTSGDVKGGAVLVLPLALGLGAGLRRVAVRRRRGRGR
jgi:signal peptidase I